jgi:hypothetical protein
MFLLFYQKQQATPLLQYDLRICFYYYYHYYFTLPWHQKIFLGYLILLAKLEPQLLDIVGIT